MNGFSRPFESRRTVKTVSAASPILLALLALAVVSSPAPAATVTVSDDGDGVGTVGTLRWAIGVVNAGDTINFVNAGPITLTQGELLINKNLTISGPGAGALTVRRSSAGGTPNFSVFRISTGNVSISGLTISGGRSAFGAGLDNEGTLTLTNCVVSGNSATVNIQSVGGGIYNSGALTINNTTIDGNVARRGGGIYHAFGTLALNGSTISSNSSNDIGGGLHILSAATITNCTIAGNTCSTNGGGIYANVSSTASTYTVALLHCTISANSVSTSNGGGGIFTQPTVNGFPSASVDVRNTILAGNINAERAGSSWTFDHRNQNGDSTFLGPLQDNGGPTKTIALLAGSAAIDSGFTPYNTTTDQRGLSRPIGTDVDKGAYEYYPPQPGPAYTVTTVGDTNDGICAGDHCSLREAITAANADGVSSSIGFRGDVNGVITLSSALPDLANNSSLTITGPGAGNLTLQRSTLGGTPDFRIFATATGSTVSISGLTLSNGRSSLGAGILNRGALTLTASVISGNTSTGGGGGLYNFGNGSGVALTISTCTISQNTALAGGGIVNDGGIANATLNLTACTLSQNAATASGASEGGGGIYAFAGVGVAAVSLTNCTLSQNTTPSRGGGVYNFGSDSNVPLALINCTLSGNTAAAGGGIYNFRSGTATAPLTLHNNLLANNTGGNIVNDGGTVASENYNLSTDGGGGVLLGGGDQVNVASPGLDPTGLQSNGGPTKTIALTAGSPAIDAGSDALVPPGIVYDQRNAAFARKTGSSVDIGAFEFGSIDDFPQSAPNFVVNTTADSNGACTRDDCSLREAVGAANNNPGGDTITFDPTVFDIARTIVVGSAITSVNGDTIITGPAPGVTVDGVNNSFAILSVNANASLSVSGMTITNAGTALFALAGGTLTVTDCRVTNSLQGVGADGTANLQRCTLSGLSYGVSGLGAITLTECTLNNNTNTNFTSGPITFVRCTVYNGSNGIVNTNLRTLVATNCTVTGISGSGIRNGGTATITGCTVTGNGTGIQVTGAGVTTVTNSIVAGNTTSDVTGSLAGGSGFNITGGTAAAAGLDPSGLQNNGGPTPTIALLDSSAAINAGDPGFNGTGLFDGRGSGFPRVSGSRVDIGAFETQLATLSSTTLTVSEGGSGILTASDPNNEAFTVGIPASPNPGSAAHGTVAYNPGNKELTYTHDGGESLSDSFIVTLDDGYANAVTVNVTILPVNDAPINTVPGAQTTPEDTPLLFSGAGANAISVDDVDATSLSITLGVTNGRLTLAQTVGLTGLSGDGTAALGFGGTIADINAALDGLRFDPVADASGPTTLTIVASDGTLDDSDTVAITTNPVNDAPANLSLTPSPTSPNEGATVSFSGSFTDVEAGDTHTVTIVWGDSSANTVLNLGAGVLSFAGVSHVYPDNGAYSIGYTVTDNGNQSTLLTVALTVNNVAPTATLGNGGGVILGATGSVSFSSQADASTIDTSAGFRYAFDFNNDNDFADAGEVGTGTYAGSSSSNSAMVPATYLNTAGNHTIRGRILDKDGGSTDYTTVILVNEAPSLIVTTVQDVTDANDGLCSLREAIATANSDPDASTISFNLPGAGPFVINLTGALPQLTTAMTINGPGNKSVTVRRDTGGNYSVITIGTGVPVNLTNLTISNGNLNFGGGVVNRGTLSATRCTISGNTGSATGGLQNTGNATLNDCTISGNIGTGSGGGGISNPGNLALNNCTISGNTANAAGGGILTTGGLTINNCTVSLNSAGQGSGIYASSGSLNVNNSIVCGNNGNVDVNSAVSLTGSNNLIGVDAKLGPLSDNGGPTRTMLPAYNSAALNAGDTTLLFDQRGIARPQDGADDIGAVELVRPRFSIAGRIVNSSGIGIASVSVTRSAAVNGSPAATVSTDSNGNYAFANVLSGVNSYTLTPSKAGYVFTLTTRTVTVSSANITGQNFTGYNATLNGRVAFSNGVGIGNVEVRLGTGRSVLTNGAGYYTFTAMLNGAYTVTPVLAGYSFDPVYRSVSINNADVANVNFIGGYAINGRIANSQGIGISGLRVYRTGAPSGSSPYPAVTNSAGYFAFYGVVNGTYTLTPDTTQGYGYTPQSRSVMVNGASVGNQNFVGTSGFNVSGRIATSNGTGISGVSVSRGAGSTPVMTNGAGYYTFYGVGNGSYTLTPSKSGMTFTPTTRSLTVNGTNVANQNFTGNGP